MKPGRFRDRHQTDAFIYSRLSNQELGIPQRRLRFLVHISPTRELRDRRRCLQDLSSSNPKKVTNGIPHAPQSRSRICDAVGTVWRFSTPEAAHRDYKHGLFGFVSRSSPPAGGTEVMDSNPALETAAADFQVQIPSADMNISAAPPTRIPHNHKIAGFPDCICDSPDISILSAVPRAGWTRSQKRNGEQKANPERRH